MSATIGISPEMSDALGRAFGVNALAYLEDSATTSPELRSHLEERLASFATEAGPLPLASGGPAAVLDLSDPNNISSSTLVMMLPAENNGEALSYAAQVSGRPIAADDAALVFVSNRFVDLPADDTAALAIGYADALYVFHSSDDRVDSIQIARGESKARRLRARLLTTAPPTWVSAVGASLPPRDTLPPTTPGEVVGVTRSRRYGATPLNFVGPEREEPDRTFRGIRGVVLQDVQLADPDASVVLRPDIVTQPSDRPSLMASRQGIERDTPAPEIEIVYPQAPQPLPETPGVKNMSYGDTRHGCAGRPDPQNCYSCCDGKQSQAVGIGMTVGAAAGAAAVTGIATAAVSAGATGALVGAAAGPLGALVGGFIGCVVGLGIALLVTNDCIPSCNKLFPSRRDNLIQRQYLVTTVLRDEDGDTAGYRGVDSMMSEWVLSRDEAVAAIDAGMQIWTADEVGPVPVRARTRLGTAYLASARDRRLLNNIGELPSEEGLPDITERGIALT